MLAQEAADMVGGVVVSGVADTLDAENQFG